VSCSGPSPRRPIQETRHERRGLEQQSRARLPLPWLQNNFAVQLTATFQETRHERRGFSLLSEKAASPRCRAVAVRPNEHPSEYTPYVLVHGNPTTDDPAGRRFFFSHAWSPSRSSQARPVAFHHDRPRCQSASGRRQIQIWVRRGRGGFTDLVGRQGTSS
jgi:hypothetical protein